MKGKKFLTLTVAAAMLVGSTMSVSAAELSAKDLEKILDVSAYRAAYADLNAAFGDDLDAYADHYLTYGVKEGRTLGVKLDLVGYADRYADLRAAFGTDYEAIAEHYLTYGIKEGRVITAPQPKNSGSSSSSSSSSNSAPATGNTAATETAGHVHDWATIMKDPASYLDGVDPTCLKDGYARYQCTEWVMPVDVNGTLKWVPCAPDTKGGRRCSETHTEILKASHIMPENESNVYVVHATCTTAGRAAYTCAVCGTQVDEVIPAYGHDFKKTGKVKTASTCTVKGKDETKCTRCGLVGEVDRDLAPHTLAGWRTIKAATCIDAGVEQSTCNICATTVTRPIAAPGHNMVEIARPYVDASFNGVAMHIETVRSQCSVCKQVETTTAVGAIPEECDGHDANGDGTCDVCNLNMNRTK